ncbi:MAG: metal-dependent transcriptional regulator [Ignavibacteria bacterium]|nr:metal-dependent transcriptional regulator [Ignavibacteria bacterium]
MSTISKENYLKAIFSHSYEMDQNASTTKIANHLAISSSAISDMAKKLSKEGLVKYEKYKGIILTTHGEKAALKVIRRHRLWELFLMKVLELDLSEVHDQAEILEHYTSDFLIDKIDEFLDYPDFDPHGHPIPKKNGTIPKTPGVIPLIDTVINQEYEFVKVNDRDNELINYLNKVGLKLHSNLEIIDKLNFDNSITIKFDNKIITLSKKIAENLYVRLKKN